MLRGGPRSHGFETGIYTGGWYWKKLLKNSDAFAHEKLWNSYYDGDPDIDGLPYGGWTTAAIEQYAGTTDLCGQSVDLNAIYEEDDMGLYEDMAAMKALLKATGAEQAGAEDIDLLASIRNDQSALTEHVENHPTSLPGATYNVTTGTLTLEEIEP